MVDWSKLPEELVLIAVRLFSVRLFSVVELPVSVAPAHLGAPPFPSPTSILSRSALSSTSAASLSSYTDKQVNERIYSLDRGAFLSRASFVCVTLSSSTSSQRWQIKYDVKLDYGKFRLLNPFSRLPLTRCCESIDLGKIKVSEIQQAYAVSNKLADS